MAGDTTEGSLGERGPVAALSRGRVLVADDELALVRAYARSLVAQGYDVISATDGLEASAALESGRFDAVVADVQMPGMTGLELLATVRRRDGGVPVVLLTGTPTAGAAEQAVASGALLYLVKPVDLRMLGQVVDHATRMRRASLLQPDLAPFAGSVGDRASYEDRFDKALGLLRVVYQPIVRFGQRSVYGYEALVRTGEPTMASPAALLEAADHFGRMRDVGRLVRRCVAADMGRLPEGARIFVNVSTAELEDPELLSATAPLSLHGPRVVLEITERASLDDVSDVAAKMTTLRSHGFRIAVDDLGAGYSGLTAFARLLPEVVKIDMSLVRRVELEPVKRELIRHIAAMCADMGILVVAEGVESCAERDVLAEIGCELMQGFLFARPADPPPPVVW
jgi:EAL domain-containing protein (putative c-di-GMP-specific phosphodiesterase class I)/CheY-like chemotaxis protein